HPFSGSIPQANHQSAENSTAGGTIDSLIARYRPGWSLPGGFYSERAAYRADIDQIWRRGWLFGAHSCELSKPGDWVTLTVDADSLILIRGEDARVHGLH